jgi:peptidoglycan endopeptidase LytE
MLYGQSLAEIAKCYLGTPYRWGGYDESGLDCSGMTQLALRRLIPNFPKPKINSQGLFRTLLDSGYCTVEERPQKDDILFYGANRHTINHCSIALNQWTMIDAAHGGRSVVDLPTAIEARAFVLCLSINRRDDLCAILRLI